MAILIEAGWSSTITDKKIMEGIKKIHLCECNACTRWDDVAKPCFVEKKLSDDLPVGCIKPTKRNEIIKKIKEEEKFRELKEAV